MKSLIQLLLIFLIAICSYSQKRIKGFTYIEDGEESFYIKNTEVTVKEYFEFVDWVIDSIARRTLAQNGFAEEFLMPEIHDTDFNINGDYIYKLDYYEKLDWDNIEYYEILIPELMIPENERFYRKREFNSKKVLFRSSGNLIIEVLPSFNYSRMLYHSESNKGEYYTNSIHPGRLIKPINSISFIQAKAYCEWKTKQLNKKNKKVKLTCRLPSIKQYEKTSKSTLYQSNWLEVYPDELERKIFAKTQDKNQKLNDSIIILKKELSIQSTKRERNTNIINNQPISPSGILDVSIFNDTINPSAQKFSRVFRSTKDYYPYKNNKSIQGLYDNVSEWTTTPLIINDSVLNEQKYEYNGLAIYLGDISNNSKVVVGGNWWHGYDFESKTFVNEETQLETIGFRYILIKN